MQGLASYADDSPPASTSQRRLSKEQGPAHVQKSHMTSVPVSSSKELPAGRLTDAKGKGRAHEVTQAATNDNASPVRSTSALSTPGPSRPRSPESRQSDRGVEDPFEGLTEDEVFRIVTRPDDIEGVQDWGIPPEVDPDTAPAELKAKVEHFLRLKYERGQHINSTLLSSSSFANPHIYAKLVEFVDISETATAFPDGGWITRKNIESLIPTYGPQALSAVQKAKQEAVRRSQEAGKRSAIQFAPGRRDDRDLQGTGGSAKKRSRDDEYRDRDRERERDRERDRNRPKERRYEDERRERERDRWNGNGRRDRR